MNQRKPPPPIIGESSAIRRGVELVERYAHTELPVLLVGTTGTGKELFAEHLHWRSGRPERLVAVNCAALPRDTAESLLFGHRKGAFTGAVESRRGYLRCANRGTLFLDEVLDLPPEVQPKLLRALDLGEVQPLSEDAPEYVDLRVVAAVQDDVSARLEAGVFRRDLFQRLAGIVIRLPPLVARPEDILPLARHFAAAQGQAVGPGVEPILRGYPWPGNARELRLAVERACALAPNGCLSAAVLAEAIELGAVPSRGNGDGHPDDLRRQLVQTLATHRWNAERAAIALGVHRATLFRHLKGFGLSIRSLRKSQ
ncbi:MAG: sigma 54-interacting transcriptional regulator [Gemmatimonadales bacterium]